MSLAWTTAIRCYTRFIRRSRAESPAECRTWHASSITWSWCCDHNHITPVLRQLHWLPVPTSSHLLIRVRVWCTGRYPVTRLHSSLATSIAPLWRRMSPALLVCDRDTEQAMGRWVNMGQCTLTHKGRTLVIAPFCTHGPHAAEALRYTAAHTKQRHTYLPYTFPAVAGTHLPTPKGWTVE